MNDTDYEEKRLGILIRNSIDYRFQFDFVLSFAIKIVDVSLYINAKHDKYLCYKLQISCLSKQFLTQEFSKV